MEEQQLVNEDPHSVSTSEGQVYHMTKGQNRPKVTVATWRSGDPGPMDGWRRTPPLKLPGLHSQFTISSCSLEHSAHIKHTRLNDLEPKEAESKGEKVGEVGVGWGWRCMRAYGKVLVPDTQGAPKRLARSKDWHQTTLALDCLLGEYHGVDPGFWLCPVFEKHMEM
ncbi:hypothetical protein HJG60_009750 [Phyllostomus discolor]|uniref:Uncharacterized protein n=1 Tax=Phyllostomus discolor TaxID=89673 RepID=A0A834B6P4_9CHIR|nr:hypothetical protein HJG60_009750 [Phyllostomus discolor]